MPSSVDMTRTAFRALVSHLVDMEESTDELVNNIYPEASTHRDEFRRLIESYITELEELVTMVNVIERPTRDRLKELDYLPFAVIGSAVLLEGPGGEKNHLYKIVSPYHIGKSDTDISYLTPLGRELLLKKVGEQIKADIDGNVNNYVIRSVKYELL